MNRLALSFLVVAFALVAPGCKSDSADPHGGHECIPAKGPNTIGSKAVNTNCPLTGEHADQSVLGEYQGAKIAFCCPGCLTKFNKMTEGEKMRVLTTATTYPDTVDSRKY